MDNTAPEKVKKVKPVKYPDKQTVNLAERPKTINSPVRAIPIFLCALVVIALFAKFGVIDQITRQQDAADALADAQSRLDLAIALNADYTKISDEYNLYSLNSLSDEELSAVDRLEIIDLLDKELLSSTLVSAVSINGNVMLVQFTGLSLEQTSELIDSLLNYPIVAGVSVSTAGATAAAGAAGDGAGASAAPDATPSPDASGEDAAATVSMTITLKQAQEEAAE